MILKKFSRILAYFAVGSLCAQLALGWTISQRQVYFGQESEANPDPCQFNDVATYNYLWDGNSYTKQGSKSIPPYDQYCLWTKGGTPWFGGNSALGGGFTVCHYGTGQYFAIDDSDTLRDVGPYITGGTFWDGWNNGVPFSNLDIPGGAYLGPAITVGETSTTVNSGTIVTAEKFKNKQSSFVYANVYAWVTWSRETSTLNRYYVSPSGAVYQAPDISGNSGTTTAQVSLDEAGTWTYRAAPKIAMDGGDSGTPDVTISESDYVIGYINVVSPSAANSRATHCISRSGTDLNQRLSGHRTSVPHAVATGIFSEGMDLNLLLGRIENSPAASYRNLNNLLNINPGALLNWNSQPIYWVSTTLPDSTGGNAMQFDGSPSHAFIDLASAAPGFITNNRTFSFGFWIRTTSGSRTINITVTADLNNNATSTDSKGRSSEYIDTTWRWIQIERTYGGEYIGSPRFFFTMSDGGGAFQIYNPMVVRNALTGYRTRTAFPSASADDQPDIAFIFEPNSSL